MTRTTLDILESLTDRILTAILRGAILPKIEEVSSGRSGGLTQGAQSQGQRCEEDLPEAGSVSQQQRL